MFVLKKKDFRLIGLLGFLLAIVAIQFVPPAKAQTGFEEELLYQDITVNNTQFESFRIDFLDMSLTPEFGESTPFITTSKLNYKDPNRVYPGVEVSYSQPFLVDNGFNYIPEEEKEEYFTQKDLNTRFEVKSDETDKVYFLKQFNVAFDVGAKSTTNLPTYAEKPLYDIWISPNNNIYHSHKNRIDYDSFDADGSSLWTVEANVNTDYQRSINAGQYDIDTRDGWEGQALTSSIISTYNYGNRMLAGHVEPNHEPYGILISAVDTGVRPWAVEPGLPYGSAKLIASLEPIGGVNERGMLDVFGTGELNPMPDTEGGTARPDWATLSSYQQALINLQSGYGNSLVEVYSRFNVQALTEFLKMGYTTTRIIDGVSVEIKVSSTSAKIGIYNVQNTVADSFELKGIVKNDFNRQQIEDQYNNFMTIPESQESGSKGTDESDIASNQVNQQDNPVGFKGITLTGSMSYIGNDPVTISGSAEANPITFPGYTPVDQISIENFDAIPTDVNCNFNFELEPATTVDQAVYDVRWSHGFWDGKLGGESVVNNGRMTARYPYAINIDNVFATKRCVLRVVVLTENEAEIIIANGRPIKVDDFNEFNINSVGFLVEQYLEGTLDVTKFSWLAFLDDLLNSPAFIVIIIVIIIIIILVIIVMISSKRRQVSGGAGGTAGAAQFQKRKKAIWITIGSMAGVIAVLIIVIAIMSTL